VWFLFWHFRSLKSCSYVCSSILFLKLDGSLLILSQYDTSLFVFPVKKFALMFPTSPFLCSVLLTQIYCLWASKDGAGYSRFHIFTHAFSGL